MDGQHIRFSLGKRIAICKAIIVQIAWHFVLKSTIIWIMYFASRIDVHSSIIGIVLKLAIHSRTYRYIGGVGSKGMFLCYCACNSMDGGFYFR